MRAYFFLLGISMTILYLSLQEFILNSRTRDVLLPPPSEDQLRIVVLIFCWNEEALLPYTLRHYERFVDKIVVFDNNSTDSSRDVVLRYAEQQRLFHGGVDVELKIIDSQGSYPQELLDSWRRYKWKSETQGKFDWVILADADEFVQYDVCSGPSGIRAFLRNHADRADVIAPVGFDMYFDKFPFYNVRNSPYLLTEAAVKGVMTTSIESKNYPTYSKPCIIQVNKVHPLHKWRMSCECTLELCHNQVHLLDVMSGGHMLGNGSEPGDIKVLYMDKYNATLPLKLLHYGPGLGSLKYRLSRQQMIRKRVESNDVMRELKLGKQYLDDGAIVRQRYTLLKTMAKPLLGVSSKYCNIKMK